MAGLVNSEILDYWIEMLWSLFCSSTLLGKFLCHCAWWHTEFRDGDDIGDALNASFAT